MVSTMSATPTMIPTMNSNYLFSDDEQVRIVLLSLVSTCLMSGAVLLFFSSFHRNSTWLGWRGIRHERQTSRLWRRLRVQTTLSTVESRIPIPDRRYCRRSDFWDGIVINCHIETSSDKRWFEWWKPTGSAFGDEHKNEKRVKPCLSHHTSSWW